MNMQQLPVISVETAPHGPLPDWFGAEPADWRRFDVGDRAFLFVVDRSRIYALTGELRDELSEGNATGLDRPGWSVLLDNATPAIDAAPPPRPPLRSLSLAVAQKCNLGCVYCYAEQGNFGGAPRIMDLDMALAAVDRLFVDASPGERLHLSFLGGEPLLAREVLRAATEYAVARGRDDRVPVEFAVTTNGTMLESSDADFFARHHFAVTVSIDGIGDAHDRLRPYKGGRGTFDDIIARVRPLLARQPELEVSARVTVTPENLELRHTLDHLIELGFHSVGFSPLLTAPSGHEGLSERQFDDFLEQMIACGREFEAHTAAGRRYPFANLALALRELHRGTHRPYSCGAGAGYFGVSAGGELFACHRFVDDPAGKLGGLTTGVDRDLQEAWLKERHVLRQEPCRLCWARFLCGGGCHYEVLRRGRPACDYVRGWLEYCLSAYVRMLDVAPSFFAEAPRAVDDVSPWLSDSQE